jgi:hypothetical protein
LVVARVADGLGSIDKLLISLNYFDVMLAQSPLDGGAEKRSHIAGFLFIV